VQRKPTVTSLVIDLQYVDVPIRCTLARFVTYFFLLIPARNLAVTTDFSIATLPLDDFTNSTCIPTLLREASQEILKGEVATDSSRRAISLAELLSKMLRGDDTYKCTHRMRIYFRRMDFGV